MEIKGFFGEHRWLSNFWITPVEYEGIMYPSVEHAYQAAKTFDPNWREIVSRAETPKKAKYYGYRVPKREDWESVKLQIMEALVLNKFLRNEELKVRLILTGTGLLEETNSWGDTFWGVCNGVGENHLGKILMKVRESFSSSVGRASGS